MEQFIVYNLLRLIWPFSISNYLVEALLRIRFHSRTLHDKIFVSSVLCSRRIYSGKKWRWCKTLTMTVRRTFFNNRVTNETRFEVVP